MAAKIRVDYSDLQIHIEGDLDRRGRKGVSDKVPVHFSAVRVNLTLATEATDKQFARLQELSERYCPVGSLMAAAVPDYEVIWHRQ